MMRKEIQQKSEAEKNYCDCGIKSQMISSSSFKRVVSKSEVVFVAELHRYEYLQHFLIAKPETDSYSLQHFSNELEHQ